MRGTYEAFAHHVALHDLTERQRLALVKASWKAYRAHVRSLRTPH